MSRLALAGVLIFLAGHAGAADTILDERKDAGTVSTMRFQASISTADGAYASAQGQYYWVEGAPAQEKILAQWSVYLSRYESFEDGRYSYLYVSCEGQGTYPQSAVAVTGRTVAVDFDSTSAGYVGGCGGFICDSESGCSAVPVPSAPAWKGEFTRLGPYSEETNGASIVTDSFDCSDTERCTFITRSTGKVTSALASFKGDVGPVTVEPPYDGFAVWKVHQGQVYYKLTSAPR